MEFCSINTDDHLSSLVSADPRLAPIATRLKSDFERRLVFGCFSANNENGSVEFYALLSHGYSTWQHRCLVITHIWLSENLDSSAKSSILDQLKQYLLSYARDNDCQRVTHFLQVVDANLFLYNWLKQNGITNMSETEDWLLFELGQRELNDLANKQLALDAEFSIVKVENINEYADSIRELIREIAVFERLLDQFDTRTDKLIRDFKQYYDCLVVVTKETRQVVGYSIYFKTYEVERGVGCFLEDLYIKEEYRKKGLGSLMWSEIARQVLANYPAVYMQWSVLSWNKPAIEFYKKFNAADLTSDRQLNFLRFTTDKIYSS